MGKNVEIKDAYYGRPFVLEGHKVEVGNKRPGIGPKEFEYDVFLDGVIVGRVEKFENGWAAFPKAKNWGNAYAVPMKSRADAAFRVAKFAMEK
jgi:hypothetical protein